MAFGVGVWVGGSARSEVRAHRSALNSDAKVGSGRGRRGAPLSIIEPAATSKLECSTWNYTPGDERPADERETPTERFVRIVNRLCKVSTKGCVSRNSRGGTTTVGADGPLGPRKSISCPDGLKKAWSVWSTRASARTALRVSRSNASCRSARVNSSSALKFST